MAAGDSAYDVARRQREKAARLQRSAELWERGAHGEAEVAKVLSQLPAGWEVLHDLPWPGRPRANIDHLAIGPGGIFVIDAKNWSGRVEVRDQVLSQNGRQRESAVISAAEAAIAVQRWLPATGVCMGVLCFVGQDDLKGWARDVMVCSTGNLLEMLTSRPPTLHREGIRLSVNAVRHHCASETARSMTPMRSQPRQRLPVRSRSTAPRQARAARPRRRARRGASLRRTVLALVGLVAFASWGPDLIAHGGEWLGGRIASEITPEQSPVEPRDVPSREDVTSQDRSSGRQ